MGEVVEAKRQEVSAPTNMAGDQLIAALIEAVQNPATDTVKMRELFALRQEVVEREARIQFNTALKCVKQAMPAIKRNRENTQTNSRYADLEAVSKVMDPIITAHGFDTSFGTADSPLANHYRITCTLSHEGGHEKEYQADIPIDIAGIKGTTNKTATHAFGSTMSYGRRYLKMMIFDVATSDDDGNKAGSECITPEQVQELEILLGHARADKAAFLKMCKIEALEDLPAKKFAGAKKRLEDKRDAA